MADPSHAPVGETSSLIPHPKTSAQSGTLQVWKALLVTSCSISIWLGCWYLSRRNAASKPVLDITPAITEQSPPTTTGTTIVNPFPDDFVWGVATSSYQIEGGAMADGRGPTIWDTFVRKPKAILDNSTGDIADDHYHLWKTDIALMKSLNVNAYRFSIAWSRILPTGETDVVNEAGIRFYDELIDELIYNDIEPWITLFHWDLPQALQDKYSGWLGNQTVNAFSNYARIVFERYGSKVKRFITLNEPWTFAVNGHGSGIHAPGCNSHPATEPYQVAHNLLLAHTEVSKMYKAEFAGTDGMIGISNCGDFRYPKDSSSQDDQDAAHRAMLFQWGWFVEPLVFGRYPNVMRQRLGSRLPHFTEAESHDLVGSADFFGLNYYSSLLASTPRQEATYDEYWTDMNVDFSDSEQWSKNDMGWNIVPDGLANMLLWIAQRYGNPLVYITENGSAEPESDSESSLHDEQRRLFLEGHIRACAAALSDGNVNLAGYFAWSLMDNFEWQFGYQRRFGICRVDFDTLKRTPRKSALWYRDTIGANGRTLFSGDTSTRRQLGAIAPKHHRSRVLPEKVLIGYGSECDAVRKAIHDGVNVVMWSFLDVTLSPSAQVEIYPRRLHNVSQTRFEPYGTHQAVITTNLDLTAIRTFIVELKDSGFGDVLHFASVGGWNGLHLRSEITAYGWYHAFKTAAGDIFDGIDWDLEGNDRMNSTENFFTLSCLDKMGVISQLAHEDGRFISMAPPQSYLDIDTTLFSRYVNLTDATGRDGWHSDFPYFGFNVYAYILNQYGEFIDLVSIQLYESFSRAGKAVYHDGLAASDYLIQYVSRLHDANETFIVDFSSDSEVGVLGRQAVLLPIRKLVFGLGNGWTGGDDQKALYIGSDQLLIAWKSMSHLGLLPRGFMFWTIMLEGLNGIYLARELRQIMNI